MGRVRGGREEEGGEREGGEEGGDGDEILGGTEYEQWARVFLFSKSTQFYDTETTQNLPLFDISRLPRANN